MQGKLEWDILTVIETPPGRCLLSTVTVPGNFKVFHEDSIKPPINFRETSKLIISQSN